MDARAVCGCSAAGTAGGSPGTAREEANTALSRAAGSTGRMKMPEVVWGKRRGGHREAAQAIL